jgi:thiosulfate dehydrogenase (quinone) large subunit
MASSANGRPSSAPVYIEEPAFSKWLFGSSTAAWIWLVARLWLGWEWLQAGWHKVFGGDITGKVWDWGKDAYSLTGDGNIGWVRSGTVPAEEGGTRTLQVGDAVAGFARGALERGTTGDNPDIACASAAMTSSRPGGLPGAAFPPVRGQGRTLILPGGPSAR